MQILIQVKLLAFSKGFTGFFQIPNGEGCPSRHITRPEKIRRLCDRRCANYNGPKNTGADCSHIASNPGNCDDKPMGCTVNNVGLATTAHTTWVPAGTLVSDATVLCLPKTHMMWAFARTPLLTLTERARTASVMQTGLV